MKGKIIALTTLAVVVLIMVVVQLNLPARAADTDYATHLGDTLRNKDMGDFHAPVIYSGSPLIYSMYNGLTPSQVIAADLALLVIELDGDTTYPHASNGSTAAIIVEDITGKMCLDGNTGKWIVKIGVIGSIDATSAEVYYFHESMISSSGCVPFDYKMPFPRPFDLTISSGSPLYFGSGRAVSETSFQTDVTNNYDFFMDMDSGAGVGDVVCIAEEVTDGNNFWFNALVRYRTK